MTDNAIQRDLVAVFGNDAFGRTTRRLYELILDEGKHKNAVDLLERHRRNRETYDLSGDDLKAFFGSNPRGRLLARLFRDAIRGQDYYMAANLFKLADTTKETE